jgi:hypothetical protein
VGPKKKTILSLLAFNPLWSYAKRVYSVCACTNNIVISMGLLECRGTGKQVQNGIKPNLIDLFQHTTPQTKAGTADNDMFYQLAKRPCFCILVPDILYFFDNLFKFCNYTVYSSSAITFFNLISAGLLRTYSTY